MCQLLSRQGTCSLGRATGHLRWARRRLGQDGPRSGPGASPHSAGWIGVTWRFTACPHGSRLRGLYFSRLLNPPLAGRSDAGRAGPQAPLWALERRPHPRPQFPPLSPVLTSPGAAWVQRGSAGPPHRVGHWRERAPAAAFAGASFPFPARQPLGVCVVHLRRGVTALEQLAGCDFAKYARFDLP